MLHFAGYHLVVGRRVHRSHFFAESVQFLAYALGLFFLGLALAYLADGVFNPFVAFAQQFLGLFLGATQDFLALTVHLLHFCFIAGNGLLHRLLVLVNVLSLAFPVAFVANDVLKVFVALYVVAAHDVARIVDHLFGQSDLARYLDGKRRTGLTNLELEECLHFVSVVEHGSVGDALVTVGIEFQVLVVGRDDAPCVSLAELVEHAFGDGTADLRFCAGSKFINQDERPLVCRFHHVLHVEQMAAVGAQVVLDALFVADVNQDVFEHPCLTVLAHRDRQSALQHVLQQSCCLQAH